MLWYRVMPMSPPWMTAGNSSESKPAAFKNTVFPDGLQSIMRTCRAVATSRWQNRGDGKLVKSDEQNKEKSYKTANGKVNAVKDIIFFLSDIVHNFKFSRFEDCLVLLIIYQCFY